MKFLIRQIVEAEIDVPDVEAAIAWCNEHTVFDLLDINGSECWDATVHSESGDLLGEAG